MSNLTQSIPLLTLLQLTGYNPTQRDLFPHQETERKADLQIATHLGATRLEHLVTLLPERIIDSRTLYEGSIVTFYVNTIVLPNGSLSKREIVGTPGAVAIVPLTDDGQVRLVRQYRSGISDFSLEIPAGTLEPGEPTDEAAPRELAEETGDRAESWRPLTSVYTTPGICDEVIHIYLATGLTGGQNHLDPDEFIDVVTLPLAQAVEMVHTGDIRDAKTIIGLLMAAQMALQGLAD